MFSTAISILSAALGWLTKPPGVYVSAAALVVLAIWISGQRGYDRGVAACAAAHQLAAARIQVQRQAAVTIAAHVAETTTAAAAAKDATNKEIVADVKARAQALPVPPPSCPLAVPADLADRLRQLN
jgi:hypothetical protein